MTDGTAVLGLGNIGPLAALPVMEGKSLLIKEFGGINAVPTCLGTRETDEIIETVVRMAPVFHDDQHGTAIVVLAALLNAARVTGRSDYPNQINNVLVFPGLFRGALDVRAARITGGMMRAAAAAIAAAVGDDLAPDHIVPGVFDTRVAAGVSQAVAAAARAGGVARA